MSCRTNPYDELPYKSYPIDWTAPERLALASLLHGGPYPPLNEYRVLELGCGSGVNLLKLAYFRRYGTFIGVDGAASQIEIARGDALTLGLGNVEFIHADFRVVDQQLSGCFDYIIAHGIFSWVPHDIRDTLLQLCVERLKPGGLLYLNYNARPGWDVRGLYGSSCSPRPHQRRVFWLARGLQSRSRIRWLLRWPGSRILIRS